MQEIKLFNVDEHLPILNSWLRERDLPTQSVQATPKLGYILYNAGEPAAVAFLRLVEGEYAILDGLCTNPSLDPSIRDLSLNLLLPNIYQAAQSVGITKLIAFSVDKNTLMRAKVHGFVQQPHTMICLDLTSQAKERQKDQADVIY